MKAVVWTNYGPPEVLQVREVEKPAPGENEVLIRIRATTVSAGDCEMRAMKIPFLFRIPMRMYAGFRKPERITILGQELAGEVESAGRDVRRFKIGDQVFGTTGLRLGAHAEYICLPAEAKETEAVLASMPSNLTFEEAACVPVGGLEALHFIRRANIRNGQSILILGAGGSIGTVAVQLAKYYGATVTALDRPGKLDMLRSIGADHVIDCTREDFTQNGTRYDVIFDVVGKSPFSRSLKSLKRNGSYLIANPAVSHMLLGPWVSMTGSCKVITGSADHKVEDLLFLKELLEMGKIKPVIDRTYVLEQTAEAHAYVETGEKKGNVIIRL